MEYIKKNFKELFNALPSMNCTYDKPSICPHCGINCDARIIKPLLYDARPQCYVFLVLQCTACLKLFTATYFIDNGKSTFCCMYPNHTPLFKDTFIEQVSPRFIDIYNQALYTENAGNIELAAIGFRSALEILIKDYAIKELGKPVDEVSGKTLYSAITSYLEDSELVKSADVVRILGNDYTHYKRKYPEHDFELLKDYMNIFISLIRTKLRAAHPPLSR